MEPKALVYQSWDEFVFESRNKEYGAYTLRKSYKDKVLFAFGISIALIIVVFVAPTLLPVSPIVKDERIFDPVILLKEPIIIRNPKPVLPVASRPPVEKVHRADLPPRVTTEPVDEPIVTIEDPVMPSTDAVADLNSEGTASGVTATSSVGVETIDLDKEYSYVQVMPEYIGGDQAMMKFLRKHLRYPGSAERLGKEGTVYVSFVVDGKGAVSKVEVVRGFHPDCDKEAVRVVSLLPNWKGGMQSGYPVSVRMVLPITFKLK